MSYVFEKSGLKKGTQRPIMLTILPKNVLKWYEKSWYSLIIKKENMMVNVR